MSNTLKVHVSLFIVSLIYGATFTIAKEVMPVYMPAEALILMRVTVAAICLFVFHAFTVKQRITDRRDFLKLFVSAMFGMAFNMLLFFKGLDITTPINGAVLMMNTPIFVVVFAALLLKEKLSFMKVGGILVAACGAIMLMGGTRFRFESTQLLGDLMVTVNAILYAFYLVYAKSLMRKYHPVTVTLWSFIFGWFIVFPFAAPSLPGIAWQHFTPHIWLCVAFITVGATFLTYVLNAYALRHASSSLVGSYIYLQPVLAVVIALLAGRDTLTFGKVLDIAVIFAGVFMVSYRRKPAEASPALNKQA